MAGALKLVIVVDNEEGPGLPGEWGFSAYVETPSASALFDADTDPLLLKMNMRALGISPLKLDFAVLSHYHYDHAGGFSYIGSAKPGLKVYVPPGHPEALAEYGLEPVVVEETEEVARGVYVVGPVKAWRGFYEISLAVDIGDRGVVLIVGCSHPGVDEMALRAAKDLGKPVYHVIGGFHEPPLKALDRLASIAQYISPMHCSGEAAKRYVRERYPGKYVDARTGTVIEY